ncbi:hypothetical protein EYF80_054115 [Liparis tanakae]|uniref:Uncharacterized protein n=1 Tax=Liparis tanakae TaxID=230148 RepID=A0A4Z2F4S4_9TELE|nr:hypothetical protein EYF80_054115 [Liparis tanakae]
MLLGTIWFPLTRARTSSYAWANSFSCEWLVGSSPGVNPAMVALRAGWGVERGRPADYRSDPAPPLRCAPSSGSGSGCFLLLLLGTLRETPDSDALTHTS